MIFFSSIKPPQNVTIFTPLPWWIRIQRQADEGKKKKNADRLPLDLGKSKCCTFKFCPSIPRFPPFSGFCNKSPSSAFSPADPYLKQHHLGRVGGDGDADSLEFLCSTLGIASDRSEIPPPPSPAPPSLPARRSDWENDWISEQSVPHSLQACSVNPTQRSLCVRSSLSPSSDPSAWFLFFFPSKSPQYPRVAYEAILFTWAELEFFPFRSLEQSCEFRK